MLIVNSPQVALSIEDPDVRRLVWTRFHQISAGEIYDDDRHGELIVVEPGDTVAALEEECGWPILHDPFDNTRFGEPDFLPTFEALEEWPGCFEIVIIANDSGAGTLVFVPKQPGIDADLLAMCARHAQPARR